jgi:hypothetical protein
VRCFYHPDIESVGLCKQCSRGICRECAAERTGGLACKGRHEHEVDLISDLVERNTKISARSGSVSFIAVIVYWGAAITCGYLLTQAASQNIRLLLGVMAAVMFVAAFANTRILLSRRTNNARSTQRTE